MSQVDEITPEMKGNTLFLRGKNNLAKRGGITPLKEAVIVKVNPKSVIVNIEVAEVKITKNGSCLPSWNAGYDMYTTREYADLALEAEKIKFKIIDALNGLKHNKIEPGKVIDAAKALGLYD